MSSDRNLNQFLLDIDQFALLDNSQSPNSHLSRSTFSDSSSSPLSDVNSSHSTPLSFSIFVPVLDTPSPLQDGSSSPTQDRNSLPPQDCSLSPIQDRNPSPPPEILRNDEDLLPDKIGNSVYSKQWLFKTLMSITKVFVKGDGTPVNSAPESGPSDQSKMEELDSKIEEDACTLWDMSANNEVASFLYECRIVDIFVEAVDKTKSPRLLEIMIGILGNMCSFDSICAAISNNKILLYNIILLSGTSDSPTLLQVFRLLNCGTVSKSSQELWFVALEENSFFMENLKFILENNLYCDVLKSAMEFLDKILNERSSFCQMWSHQPYTFAIITAADQLLKGKSYEGMDPFFCVINTLFQQVPNIKTYAVNYEILQPLFLTYFTKLIGEETLPKVSRLPSVSCSFAVFGTILKCKCHDLKTKPVLFDGDALNSVYKLALSARNILAHLSKMRVDSSDNETEGNDDDRVHYISMMPDDEYHDWAMLLEAILYGMNEMAFYARTDCEKEMMVKIASLSYCKA